MRILSALWSLNDKTRASRAAIPSRGKCQINVDIGASGYVDIDIWAADCDFGRIASITIGDPDEIDRLARALSAIAAASRAINCD